MRIENIKPEDDGLSDYGVGESGEIVKIKETDGYSKQKDNVPNNERKYSPQEIDNQSKEIMKLLRIEDDQGLLELNKEKVHEYFVKAVWLGKKEFILELIDNLVNKYRREVGVADYPKLVQERMKERIEFLEEQKKLINLRA